MKYDALPRHKEAVEKKHRIKEQTCIDAPRLRELNSQMKRTIMMEDKDARRRHAWKGCRRGEERKKEEK